LRNAYQIRMPIFGANLRGSLGMQENRKGIVAGKNEI
jgi:hypothetical protein